MKMIYDAYLWSNATHAIGEDTFMCAGSWFEYDKYTNRYYELEASRSLRPEMDGALVKRRISKAMYMRLLKETEAKIAEYRKISGEVEEATIENEVTEELKEVITGAKEIITESENMILINGTLADDDFSERAIRQIAGEMLVGTGIQIAHIVKVHAVDERRDYVQFLSQGGSCWFLHEVLVFFLNIRAKTKTPIKKNGRPRLE